jgi:hypothetical protein
MALKSDHYYKGYFWCNENNGICHDYDSLIAYNKKNTKPIKIILYNENKELLFNSKSSASKFLNISRKTLDKAINSNLIYNNYMIKEE